MCELLLCLCITTIFTDYFKYVVAFCTCYVWQPFAKQKQKINMNVMYAKSKKLQDKYCLDNREQLYEKLKNNDV